MASLQDKIKFAEKYIKAPDGEPFSLVGREWVLNEIWRPLDGWKLWANDAKKLCDRCTARIGEIVNDYDDAGVTTSEKHRATGCDGLHTEPILVVAAHVKRQSGKTFNVAAWALSRIFLQRRESIALLAGSEDQVKRLYEKNYRGPIERVEALASRARCLGTRISIEKNGSDLELLPTSISSVGDTRTSIVLDECRIVPPNVAVAMLPTLFARGGWECPHNHFRTHTGVDDPKAPRVCSACQAPARPWYGKALLLSSAGEIRDNEQDWFFEFKDHYKANPDPNVHVFDSTEALNPKISQKVVDATARIFGGLDSTKVYADSEAHNIPRRKGEEFVSSQDLAAAFSDSITNAEDTDRPCVAFLDWARKVEKISLVFVADSGTTPDPWGKLHVARVDIWEPQAFAAGEVDEEAFRIVRDAVLARVPLFSGLVGPLRVDTRGDMWAVRMATELRKAGLPVEQWDKPVFHESDAGWKLYQQRIKTRTILHPDGALPGGMQRLPIRSIGAVVREELRGVIVKNLVDGQRVTDKNRKRSHKDVTECIALCCYLIAKQASQPARAGLAAINKLNQASTLRSQLQRVRPMTRGLRPESY